MWVFSCSVVQQIREGLIAFSQRPKLVFLLTAALAHGQRRKYYGLLISRDLWRGEHRGVRHRVVIIRGNLWRWRQRRGSAHTPPMPRLPGTRWFWPGSPRAPLSTWSPISFDPALEEEHRLDFPPQRRTASIDLNLSSHKEGSHELMKVRQNRTNEQLWLEATESETD